MSKGKRDDSLPLSRSEVDRDFSFERSFIRKNALDSASDSMGEIEKIRKMRRRRSLQIEDPPAPTPKSRRRKNG